MPPYHNEFASYADLFAHAVNRSLPEGTIRIKRLSIPEDRWKCLMREVSKLPCDTKYLAGNCFKWSMYLAPIVKRQLCVSAWPTLGQFAVRDGTDFSFYYEPTPSDAKRWMCSGLNKADLTQDLGFPFHVWLTLENGFIFDPTIRATLSKHCRLSLPGQIVGNPDEEELAGYRYVPLLVGRKSLDQIEHNSPCELTARHAHDLKYPTELYYEM